MGLDVEAEVKQLVEEIGRLGAPNADGKTSVKFGVLFADDRCANIFEVCSYDLARSRLFGSNKLSSSKTAPRRARHPFLVQALVGTLRAAKKRKIIFFEGEMLLQGAHDNVDIVVL